PFVTVRFIAVATGGETSRDNIIIYPCVLPDLLYGITVDVRVVPNSLLGCPPKLALYQVLYVSPPVGGC
ncbi:MAG: hypothetical protein U9N85_09160, partial [Bacteroidota bacterium]|nr:hypothetical protein [Bacteroidota bacterium]